jgi:hypothetical protein
MNEISSTKNKELNVYTFFTFLLVNIFFLIAIRELIFARDAMNLLIVAIAFLALGGFIGLFALKWINHKWIIGISGLCVVLGRMILLYPETPILMDTANLGLEYSRMIEVYILYYIGAGITWCFYGIFITAFFGVISKWKQTKILSEEQSRSLISVIPPAYLFAFGLTLIMRVFAVLHCYVTQSILSLLTIIFLLQMLCAYPESVKGLGKTQTWKKEEDIKKSYPKKRISFAKIIIFIQLALFNSMLFLPGQQPELLAYQAGISYNYMLIVLFATLGVISIIGYSIYERFCNDHDFRIKIMIFLAISNFIVLGLFGSYLFLPAKQIGSLFIYIFTFSVVGLNIMVLFREIWSGKPSQMQEFLTALYLFISNFLVIGIRLLVLERHMPYVWYIVWSAIAVIGLFLYIHEKKKIECENRPKLKETPELHEENSPEEELDDKKVENSTETSKELTAKIPAESIKSTKSTKPSSSAKPGVAAILLCMLVLFPMLGAISYDNHITKPTIKKDVWASLYTWYGVPGGPAGKYGIPQLDGTTGNWSMAYSNVTNPQTITAGNIHYYNGGAVSTANALILNSSQRNFISTRNPSYIEIQIAASGPQFGDVELNLIFGGKMYYTTLLNATNTPNIFYTINKVFPKDFMNGTYNGTHQIKAGDIEILITQQINTDGNYNLQLGYMETSRWKHYDEDYHTIPSEEDPNFWLNDPPVFKATAHNVFYNQSSGPWPEIETYGYYDHTKWNEINPANATQYGIYDSLDPVVIRSQLRLMEKAGIDVCQIMHPWGLDVVELIIGLADSINSNLTFFLYGGANGSHIADLVVGIINNVLYSDYYYKINGRPVYNYGFTSYVNQVPLTALGKQVVELKRMYPNLYLVGDGFSSPYTFKEELLDVLDGWYYYDTSAFYRHGWGDPAVLNYQADGTIMENNAWNQMDRIFGMQSVIAHSKGKSYCAIIIPGTDNTCVHDFKGQPLYDGRTGTINERANGLTFNRTWEAAIESGADHACIVSWNELHEGTEIEPTIEDGTYYVNSSKIWAGTFRSS